MNEPQVAQPQVVDLDLERTPDLDPASTIPGLQAIQSTTVLRHRLTHVPGVKSVHTALVDGTILINICGGDFLAIAQTCADEIPEGVPHQVTFHS